MRNRIGSGDRPRPQGFDKLGLGGAIGKARIRRVDPTRESEEQLPRREQVLSIHEDRRRAREGSLSRLLGRTDKLLLDLDRSQTQIVERRPQTHPRVRMAGATLNMQQLDFHESTVHRNHAAGQPLPHRAYRRVNRQMLDGDYTLNLNSTTSPSCMT